MKLSQGLVVAPRVGSVPEEGAEVEGGALGGLSPVLTSPGVDVGGGLVSCLWISWWWTFSLNHSTPLLISMPVSNPAAAPAAAPVVFHDSPAPMIPPMAAVTKGIALAAT